MLWRNTSRIVLPEVDPGAAAPAFAAEAGYDYPVVDCAADPFTDLVLSWNAVAPLGTAIRCAARVRHAPAEAPGDALWSAWYDLGHWGSGTAGAEPLPRSAAPGADDAAVRLAVDTLRLADGREGTAFQARVTLYGGDAGPELERLTVSTTHRGAPVAPEDDPPLGRPVALTVPARSQCVERPEIAGDICSPTSVAMVLEYYGIARPTEEVARGVYDHGARIYGNWPFNIAFAASLGFTAEVRHFRRLGDLERALQAGRPVIISIAFGPGDLPEAPIASTGGHLLVVTGVTAAGDFLVNDPAAHPGRGQAIAREYGRERLRRAWLGHGGIAYVITAGSAATAAPGPASEA